MSEYIFTINRNNQLFISGMNGSGKTTLIQNMFIYESKDSSFSIYDILLYSDVLEKKLFATYIYQLHLENVIYKPINLLSSGQKKKVFFLGLMLRNNDVWIIDEPDNFIDYISIDLIKKKSIEHLNSGGYFIVTKKKLVDNFSSIRLLGSENYWI